MEKNKVIAYHIHEDYTPPVTIEPGTSQRKWMDDTPSSYAYRCLPLSIANQHGWAVYLKRPVRCIWNGSAHKSGIEVIDAPDAAISIFGNGILTFHIHYVIRTPPSYNLYISGAPNHFIANVWPLTGIYEADWAPYTFTMNWRILRPGGVEFLPTDPICFFFPVRRDDINNFELEIKPLSDDLELKRQYFEFSESRKLLNNTRKDNEWHKNYFQGKYPDGTKCPVDHQVKLKLKGSSE
jgi:hypothetical protein